MNKPDNLDKTDKFIEMWKRPNLKKKQITYIALNLTKKIKSQIKIFLQWKLQAKNPTLVSPTKYFRKKEI